MVHEAFCIDSQGAYLWGVDDFVGDSIDARWRATVVGTGVAATVVDAQDGGIVRLSTGATTGGISYLDWGDIHTLHVNKRVAFEYRVKLSSITNFTVTLEIKNTNNDRIYFYNSGSDVYIRCEKNNVGTSQDSGINFDTDWHIYKVECFPTGEVHFYIDNVECANSPITTNIPDDLYLQPTLYINNSADEIKLLDMDYAQWRQDI